MELVPLSSSVFLETVMTKKFDCYLSMARKELKHLTTVQHFECPTSMRSSTIPDKNPVPSQYKHAHSKRDYSTNALSSERHLSARERETW